jgi:tyrosyl-tRNA synthetase
MRYYELATEVGEEELRKVGNSLKQGTENPKNIKAGLARKVVRMYYGETQARAAHEEFERRFGSKRGTLDLKSVEMKVLHIKSDKIWIVDLLRNSGLVKTGGEARRSLTAGAVRIDGGKIMDSNFELSVDGETEVLLKVGRRFKRVIIQPTTFDG